MAEILRQVFRESDVIARIGGDEFAILAPDNDESTADVVLARLKSQIDAFNSAAGRRYKISLSAGVACYSPDAPATVQELVREADEKLYAEKRRARPNLKLETA
jgi:diguanylate cyclase (GGDEF)-like protein